MRYKNRKEHGIFKGTSFKLSFFCLECQVVSLSYMSALVQASNLGAGYTSSLLEF